MLEARSLTHNFGGLCAISDLSFRIREGEMLGIIGPNGAGKTTVFNIISGVYRASEGSILFGGAEIVGLPPDRIVGMGVARTFQNIRLFSGLSVLDNIRIAHFGRTQYGALEALLHMGRYRAEEARVREHSMELLSGFKMDDMHARLAGDLPYGMQRRLEIVRALATGPRLLLLDEPAAGMNHGEIEGLMEFLHDIRGRFGLTVALIEHQMRLVMGICERLVVLDFGRMIAEGAPGEIQKDPRVLEAYLGVEAGAGAADGK